MTYEHLKGILVVVSGPFPVKRCTEGIIRSYLHRDQSPMMDVETPTKGHDRD
jgi:hypothetical protein